MIVFGPVPSRRLGRSLGINNIPSKVCSYSCIYCQVGKTDTMQVKRRHFYEPEDIITQVTKQIENVQAKGESIDYLTFVPDGEPTLDINLGREIDLLKPLGFQIGVITNSSLIDRDDVKSDLNKADWVSVKVDAYTKKLWRNINRPHQAIALDAIRDGLLYFSKNFQGDLVTETMLLRDRSGGLDDLHKMVDFISSLNPKKAYIAIPTRPTAETRALPPDPDYLNLTFQIFNKNIDQVEYLIGYEGNAFAFSGDAEKDILSITSVHPMRESAVRRLLSKANKNWEDIVEKLLFENRLIETRYNNHRFFMRNIHAE